MQTKLKEIDLKNIVQYQRPCLITLSGQSGSGKTLLAQQLSRELKIFLLSNDYIRTYFLEQERGINRKQIEREVLRINSERLAKLLIKRASFVLDRDFNREKELRFCNKIGKICGYLPIHIKIDSKDKENMKRIQNRIADYHQQDMTIIGDNVAYSLPFTEEEYFQIKKSKPRMIENFPFDYTLNNDGTEDFMEQGKRIITDIKVKKLTKYENKVGMKYGV